MYINSSSSIKVGRDNPVCTESDSAFRHRKSHNIIVHVHTERFESVCPSYYTEPHHRPIGFAQNGLFFHFPRGQNPVKILPLCLGRTQNCNEPRFVNFMRQMIPNCIVRWLSVPLNCCKWQSHRTQIIIHFRKHGDNGNNTRKMNKKYEIQSKRKKINL